MRKGAVVALALAGSAAALPVQAAAHHPQRLDLQARVAAVRAGLAAAAATAAGARQGGSEDGAAASRPVAQAANWTNWPKWSKWSNWANK